MKPKTPFLSVETHGISRAEYEQVKSPYHQQQELLALLAVCWDHNAAILKLHGYHVPSDWTATPMTQNISEPDALDAYRVIQACCDLWKSIRSKDPFAIANAGFWLGRMTGKDQFDQYNRRNAGKDRSLPKQRAKFVFNTRQTWPSAKAFMEAVEMAGIPAPSLPQGRKWFSEFRKEAQNSLF